MVIHMVYMQCTCAVHAAVHGIREAHATVHSLQGVHGYTLLIHMACMLRRSLAQLIQRRVLVVLSGCCDRCSSEAPPGSMCHSGTAVGAAQGRHTSAPRGKGCSYFGCMLNIDLCDRGEKTSLARHWGAGEEEEHDGKEDGEEEG